MPLLPVIPQPRKVEGGEEMVTLRLDRGVSIEGEVSAFVARETARRLYCRFGVEVPLRPKGSIQLKRDPAHADGAYHLRIAQNGETLIEAATDQGLLHGVMTLLQLLRREEQRCTALAVDIHDEPAIKNRGLLVDLGGQGYFVGPARWTLEKWETFVNWMVDYKLNVLYFEFIGSGRLMGNLNISAGEWCGWPVDLKSYPEQVCRNRTIRKWDSAAGRIVETTYTAPNVTREFMPELIEYCKERGIRPYLFIGYGYFANQLPVLYDVPASTLRHPKSNRIYDDILREIVSRYHNASGVCLHTIEGKHWPPETLQDLIKRMKDGYHIIQEINPNMEVHILADYLTWQKDHVKQIRQLREALPKDIILDWAPHREWLQAWGDAWYYHYFTQYAWDHMAHLMVGKIHEEVSRIARAGYTGSYSQAWYSDICQFNLMGLAEWAWNPDGATPEHFYRTAIAQVFGNQHVDALREMLENTRGILGPWVNALIKLSREETTPSVIGKLPFSEAQLAQTAARSQRALSLAKKLQTHVQRNRELLHYVISSSTRRLHFCKATLHYMSALKASDAKTRAYEMGRCVEESEEMIRGAQMLEWDFPMTVRDDEVHEFFVKVAKAATRKLPPQLS